MKRAAVLAAAALACVLGGAAAFSVTDHVGFWLACYWAISTATTVGYGDIAPRSTAAHETAVVMMLTAIPLLGAAFASVTAAHVHRHVRDHIDRALAARDQQDDKEGKP